MGVNKKFLVVVSAMEGRNFPKRNKFQLVIEAKFDGELLATDPVDHVDNPNFTQELAWEIDKKGLQQHRMQRTTIKVQCYAVDVLTTAREVIGYVMLDLRSARSKQAAKWFPLLHSKYPKLKPELLLSIYIDEDGEDEGGFKAKEAPARRGLLPPESSISDEICDVDYIHLKPVLHEDKGYYQLGPDHLCTEYFTLSVTVAFAANLTQLIPTSVPLPANSGGYFFYFSLLGNDVTNEPFFDLLNPNFPAERASVRIRSNIDALRAFFKKQPGIQVHLCCGDQSLGSTEIPLDSLLQKDSTEIFMKPVTIEGAFEMHPPNRWKSQLHPLPESLQPNVGIAVVLRREDDEMAAGNLKIIQETGGDQGAKRQSGEGGHDGEEGAGPSGGKAADDTGEDLSSMVAEKAPQDAAPPAQGDDVKPASPRTSVTPPGPPAAVLQRPPQHRPSVKEGEKTRGAEGGETLSYTPPHMAVPPQLKRYSFSVELSVVRNLDVPHSVNVYLRYVYPFFGSAAPVTTHPAVEVRKNMQVTLPRSYCAFDFATTSEELTDTFHRVPLVVEVYDRNKELSKEILIGVSQLPLAAVLDEKRCEVVRGSDGGVTRTLAGTIPILLPEGAAKKMGELDFKLVLDDHGAYQPHAVQIPASVTETSETIHVEPTRKVASPKPPPAPSVDARAAAEYQAAIELELWKEAQEKLFEAHLREREGTHMKALGAEWKKRDSERESLFQKRLTEYNLLEKQLRSAVGDLNKRETQIKDVELEVNRLKADLQREHDHKMRELQEASKRVKEESEHRVQLERKKSSELDELITRLKTELIQADKKYQALDQEFILYKERQSSKPEIKLQAEINMLTLEKVELERKLDSLSKSKFHYKQQWGKALKELARLKEHEQTVAKKNLKKQQQELEHMRLRYLAAEEKEIVQSERNELAELRQQLKGLQEQQEARKVKGDASTESKNAVNTIGAGEGIPPYVTPEQRSAEEHIARLIEERDTLLRTGVYSTEDRIIAELDRQIREAINRQTS